MQTPDASDVDAVLLVDEGRQWLRLQDPQAVLIARLAQDVAPVLAEVERQTRAHGWHAAGFLTYEAGAAFGLRVHAPDQQLPLVGFALFRTARPTSQPTARSPA